MDSKSTYEKIDHINILTKRYLETSETIDEIINMKNALYAESKNVILFVGEYSIGISITNHDIIYNALNELLTISEKRLKEYAIELNDLFLENGRIIAAKLCEERTDDSNGPLWTCRKRS